MNALNKKASAIFLKLIELLEKSDKDHMKLDSGSGYMPLSFEKLGEVNICNRQAINIAMAHYFKMNGDLVPDPDMTFFYFPETKQVFPATFQNQLYYKESMYWNGKTWMFNDKEQKDQADFANKWLNNIKIQQGI